jgi:hypothetical protein
MNKRVLGGEIASDKLHEDLRLKELEVLKARA